MPFTSGFYTCWEETSLQGKESECAAIHLQSMPLYSRDFRSTCHTHLWACTITYWILFQHSSFDCDPARWAAVTSLFTGLATASNHTEATAMQSWGYLGRKNERQTNCSGSMLNKASSLTSLRSGEGLPQIHVLQRCSDPGGLLLPLKAMQVAKPHLWDSPSRCFWTAASDASAPLYKGLCTAPCRKGR